MSFREHWLQIGHRVSKQCNLLPEDEAWWWGRKIFAFSALALASSCPTPLKNFSQQDAIVQVVPTAAQHSP
jgi:hypothetical protein